MMDHDHGDEDPTAHRDLFFFPVMRPLNSGQHNVRVPITANHDTEQDRHDRAEWVREEALNFEKMLSGERRLDFAEWKHRRKKWRDYDERQGTEAAKEVKRRQMTPLEIAREMVAVADHQREQYGVDDNDGDRVARELLRVHDELIAWRTEIESATLDHGWQIVDRIDGILQPAPSPRPA